MYLSEPQYRSNPVPMASARGISVCSEIADIMVGQGLQIKRAMFDMRRTNNEFIENT